MKHPERIHFTIAVGPDLHVNHSDVLVYLWVSSVSSSRNYRTLTLLLTLFSRNGQALNYIWDNFLKLTLHYDEIYQHPCLPWQLHIPSYVAFHGNYQSSDLPNLIMYMTFLIDTCQFPVRNSQAIYDFCTWTNHFLAGNPHNRFAPPQVNISDRRAVVNNIHANQPWANSPPLPHPVSLLMPCTPPRRALHISNSY